jgi:hypothetical protein
MLFPPWYGYTATKCCADNFSFTNIFYLENSIWSIEILFFTKVFLQKIKGSLRFLKAADGYSDFSLQDSRGRRCPRVL